MKIGIDARLMFGNATGIGIYTRGLISEINRIDKKNSYTFYMDNDHVLGLDLDTNKRAVSINCRRRNIWNNLLLPFYLRRHNIDLYHGVANFEVPLIKKCRYVITVHDLIPIVTLKTTSRKFRFLFKSMLGRAVKMADRVIAVSHSTKEDIIKYYNIDGDKITVIYNGIGKEFKPIDNGSILEDVKKKYNISKRFILYVGALEPRKNVISLLKVFNELRRNGKLLDHQLVIVGQKWWNYNEIFKYARNRDFFKGDLIFLGFIKDRDLPLIYNASDIFVFLSYYEGFGFPPLEAAACGAPVITSNNSSLAEIFKDTAVLVNPYDEKEIAESLLMVIRDSNLREKLSKKGINLAQRFSWDKTAMNTLNVYKEAYDH